MTTPASDDNPFQAPEYAAAPPVPQLGAPKRLTVATKVLLVLAVVLALGAGTGAAFGVREVVLHTSLTPVAGDCLYLTDDFARDGQEYHQTSCTSTSAVYHVDLVESGRSNCHGGDYTRFQLYSGRDTTGIPSKTLCLALNVISGDCLRDVDDEASVTKVSCTAEGAQVRAVVHGGSDPDVCGEGDEQLDYPGPPARVICLQPAGENI